jgi:hypothetical protein
MSNRFRGHRGINLHFRQNHICVAFYASMDVTNELSIQTADNSTTMAAASLARVSYPSPVDPSIESDEVECVSFDELRSSRVLRSKSAWIRKLVVVNCTLSKHLVVAKTMDDEKSANDSDSVDYIVFPNAESSVNSTMFFNARAVFASLLSCPNLNQDHKYMFRDPTNIFASPSATWGNDVNILGDINTCTMYKATYSKPVVDNDLGMLLPAILGLDKIHFDTGSHLQMEPLNTSYGL